MMMKNKEIQQMMYDELGGELSQMYELLYEAIRTKDKDGAMQVYSMILYHIAHKHNPSLITALDDLVKDL